MTRQRKALFIVGHTPSVDARQAGHRLAFGFLKNLERDYCVDVVVLCNLGTEEVEGIAHLGPSVQVITYTSINKAIGVARAALKGIPPRFASRFSPKASAAVRDLLRANRYALIRFEFSQAFWMLPLAKKLQPSARTVLSAHDLQLQVVDRKSRFERTLFLQWTKCYERRLFRLADEISVLSRKDADIVGKELDHRLTVRVSAPELSSFVSTVNRLPNKVEPFSLLFWGAMNRPENYRGVLSFISRVLPRVRAVFPLAKLTVVGNNPPMSLLRRQSDFVKVTGYVADPSRYFEKAALGIVPLLSGAGIKLKTMEMLKAGLTVVSTPIGAEGVEACPELIVTEFDSMADEIVRYWCAMKTERTSLLPG
jgi:hypothetical protein